MPTILFKFSASGAANKKALSDLTRLFDRAGAQIVSTDVSPTTSKRAGVTFRNVNLTFADGQRVTLAVKDSGDVFEVRINNSVVPLRNQDDHAKAIAEIAARMDSGRSKFQRALARVKVPLPPSARVSRTTLVKAKTDRRDALKEAVEVATVELNELLAEEGAAA